MFYNTIFSKNILFFPYSVSPQNVLTAELNKSEVIFADEMQRSIETLKNDTVKQKQMSDFLNTNNADAVKLIQEIKKIGQSYINNHELSSLGFRTKINQMFDDP